MPDPSAWTSTWWPGTVATFDSVVAWVIAHRSLIDKGESLVAKQFGQSGVVIAYSAAALLGLWTAYRVIRFIFGLTVLALVPAALLALVVSHVADISFQPVFAIFSLVASVVYISR